MVGLNEERTNNVLDDDDDDDFVIWRLDPTGQFWKLDASAVGRAAINVESELLNKVRKWMQKKYEQMDSEESKVDISNADMKAFLSSLTVEEAVTVANDCIVNGIMSTMKRSNLHSDGPLDSSILEKSLRRRVKTAVIRPGPFGASNSYIELVRG
jgi:20S proteasome alpha/beta subunit